MSTLNDRSKSRRSNQGFTLIELIVTVIVLAILTAVALPSFQSLIAGQRIKSASFDIMAALMLTRSEAIKRNANVDLKPNNGNWQNGWTVSLNGTTLNQESALASNIAIQCFSGASTITPCPTVTYTGSGRLSTATLTASPSIQLSSTATTGIATQCIGIDLSGRPNTKKANCP
jgi:type IV fimbrial biogenesis protein FimT